jgi:hypothetical protein
MIDPLPSRVVVVIGGLHPPWTVQEWQRRRLSSENSLSQFTPVRGELDHCGQQPRLHIGGDHEEKLVAAGGGGGLPQLVVAAD